MANGVTLRGSGPQSTTLNMATGTLIQYHVSATNIGGGALSGSPSAGTASVTIPSTTGTPVVGNVAWFNQCDSGFSGSWTTNGLNTCPTGSQSDNGAFFICGFISACSGNNVGNTANVQQQYVLITSVTPNGGGSYTVGFTPGIYLPNWSTANTVGMYWQNQSSIGVAIGPGLEAVTVLYVAGSNSNVDLANSYASWVKNTRQIGDTANDLIQVGPVSLHDLVMNNYGYSQLPSSTTALGGGVADKQESSSLVLNNILVIGLNPEGAGSEEGSVYGYNYIRDVDSTNYQTPTIHHDPGTALALSESQQSGGIQDDATWGTHDADTTFRNNYSCDDPPFIIAGAALIGIGIDSFARFDNAIGNVIGPGCANYQGTSAGTYGVFFFNNHGLDTIAQATSFRWGNYDTVTGAARYCGPGFSGFTSAPCNGSSATGLSASESTNTVTVLSTQNPGTNATVVMTLCSPSGYNGTFVTTASNGSQFQYTDLNSGLGAGSGCTATLGSEVPTVLAGNAFPYNNSVPASTALPPSFFLPTTAHPSGGTGLSWWKVCTTWASFPTSCSVSTTNPFPANGPDVSGGNLVNGFAYDIPASLAWKNLPTDTSFQNSYTVTASGWLGGFETLTVSGLPGTHVMGGFQLSGVNAACLPTSGVSFTGRSDGEILITGSTATTVLYATSNPGVSCTGTLKWPDIRQFDERVYQNDPTPPPNGTPSGGALMMARQIGNRQ
jgi:hypothetical protein